jgi:hypothetical protein
VLIKALCCSMLVFLAVAAAGMWLARHRGR